MPPRARLAALAVVSLLVGGGWLAAGCNAILGIDEHELASDAEASGRDGSVSHDGGGSGGDGSMGDDGAASGSDSAVEAGSFEGGSCPSPGATQCSGAASVQICGTDLVWGAPFACATAACAQGACAGTTTDALSCSGTGAGLDDCGSSKGGESCCTSIEVPGGSFARTFDEDAGDSGAPALAADGGPTQLADPATVSGYRLDKYEVTVARFRSFVDALSTDAGALVNASGKHTHLNGGLGLGGGGSSDSFEPGWDAVDFAAYIHTGSGGPALWTADLSCNDRAGETWSSAPGANEGLPVMCTNWFQAYAFCIWDGGFLPSEAEWEYAAAGGALQRPYPWGASFDGSSLYGVIQCDYLGDAGHCSGTANISPPGAVATAGAGLWGQLDMMGNAWEWTLDYPGDFPVPCVNCTNLTPDTADPELSRVDKGGGFDSPAAYGRTTERGRPTSEDAGTTNIGFRCARTP